MSRGRTAETPAQLPAQGWKDIAFRVKDEVAADRVGLIAAGVAFYGFLAIFPAIAAVMAVSGLFIDPSQVTTQIQSLSNLLPQDIIDIVITQARSVTGSDSGGLGLTALLGVLIALYSASKGMASLMDGINVAYDEEEKRGFIKLKLVTFALTLFLVFGLLISLGVTLGLPAVLSFVDLGSSIEPLVLILSFATIALLTVLGLSVLYRYGPSRDAPEWSWASVGAVVGCALWLFGSVGFAYYVKSFGSYNESFGSLAGVVIMLTWLWLSAFIILLGAELNAEMEAQTRRDTTQGQDLPMGSRDAEKADTLGEATK
ncbi:YihY/virulence factor BrkB family protein [uncultured Sulfitobacter sp.]|uniref:YihY/virulence factor BrkB family protein n=1 Tax=uncultured Sulfitobacter sp. TaxID=191468 RepID=UPI002635B482|nr:YihY/virulence factor BrkB family protein [uncultured Sulfitobacter sp.]